MKKKQEFCECDSNNKLNIKPPFSHLLYCYACKLISKPIWVKK